MTAVSALLLAIISGWLVPAPRLAMSAFLGPWLVVLIYQTLDIGLGYAVSPSQTVTQFPRVIGYVVVTAVILALGLALAALIAEWRSRVVPDALTTAREMVKRAVAAGTAMVAALIVLDIVDHAALVWPESTAHHADRLDELRLRRVLEEEPTRPAVQRLVNVLVVVEGGKHQDAGGPGRQEDPRPSNLTATAVPGCSG